MAITSGIIKRAQKVVIYGPEGIGKSTFASCFPGPLFIDIENGTSNLDVKRLKRSNSWEMLLSQLASIQKNPSICKTLVIDTIDWAERLCLGYICAKNNKKGIEDFGYGKGYVYLMEEMNKFLDWCDELIKVGINVVLLAHAQIVRFEQPDETGSYDRWELKLQKKTAPIAKEWADALFFANYKTIVVNVDNKGASKGKNKAQGGKRVMYTTHNCCWDAKNRYGLADEIDFDYSLIAPHIDDSIKAEKTEPSKVEIEAENEPVAQPVKEEPQSEKAVKEPAKIPPPGEYPFTFGDEEPEQTPEGIPKKLVELMTENKVSEAEIRTAVASKNYYTQDTPINKYDSTFIEGVLIGAWEQVFAMIKNTRK